MKPNGSRSDSKPSRAVRVVRVLVAGVAAVASVATLAAGCLQRPLAEPSPRTSNVFVDQIRQTAVDKIDLLFMIDNSASMADKQQILGQAVPQLLDRLVNPDCVNPTTGVHSAGATPCPAGTAKEFNPVNDIHIGIVTSSLGGHGADLCSPSSAQWDVTQDDHGHLLPTVRTGLTSYNNLGFLAWKPGDATAIGDPAALVAAFTPQVTATGETGCGFESQLEGWYRFLVDPDPPTGVTVNAKGQAVVASPDTALLAQRKSFLRADSLLAIVMLTDENDCSIVDGGIGWIVGSSTIGNPPKQFRMPSATSTCATDPNSPCCRSCGVTEASPPSGCQAAASDPGCATKTLSADLDPLNLRCWDQKKRFGIDLLYPTSRYVTGLTATAVKNRAGTAVSNPIYTDLSGTGVIPRDSSLVFLAGIVGVPWQDIADDASLAQGSTTLRYLTADELVTQGRWPVILEDQSTSPWTEPTDALMIESNVPRTGKAYFPPPNGSALGAATSTNPQENPVNGHEYTPSASAGDLEYACIFPLATPEVCTKDNLACDCSPDQDGGTTGLVAANRPLCQPPGGGAVGTTQYWAKAYPGQRELRVLKDFGKNSIVASICPKIVDQANPDFGYNPAVAAIIDRLKEVLSGRCLPRQLGVNCDGTLQCKVLETKSGGCDCTQPGLISDPKAVDQATRDAVLHQLQISGVCGGIGQTTCDKYCMCPVKQIQTSTVCLNDLTPDPTAAAGYCYIDAAKNIGNPDLVKTCPETQKRLLRFVGPNLPAKGAVTFIACAGATFINQQTCDAAAGK